MLLDLKDKLEDVYTIGSLRRAVYPDAHEYYRERNFALLIKRLKQSGYIKEEYVEAKKIIKLTQKGELEALFKKSLIDKFNPSMWDGQWTIFAFDVPEHARGVRRAVRKLLFEYEFKKLQDSVYISPRKFPESTFVKLKEDGLEDYITIAIVSQISNEKALKKKFSLK